MRPVYVYDRNKPNVLLLGGVWHVAADVVAREAGHELICPLCRRQHSTCVFVVLVPLINAGKERCLEGGLQPSPRRVLLLSGNSARDVHQMRNQVV